MGRDRRCQPLGNEQQSQIQQQAFQQLGQKLVQADLARCLTYMVEQERAAAGKGRMAGLAAAHSAFYRGDLAREACAQIGGGGENFAAIMGGHTQLTVLSSSEYQTYKANGIRALAYSGPERLKLEPEIPTARELGLGFDYCAENFWFAPKGTPREAIEGMADALEKANGTPDLKDFFEKQAQTGQFMRGPAYAKRLDDVFKMIEPVAKLAAPAPK